MQGVPTFVLIVLTITQQLIQCTQSQPCDPCEDTVGTVYKVKPDTACVEYVQCKDGENTSNGSGRCSGDTIYDEESQSCNLLSNVKCVEPSGCIPTSMPTTKPPTLQPITSSPVFDFSTIEVGQTTTMPPGTSPISVGIGQPSVDDGILGSSSVSPIPPYLDISLEIVEEDCSLDDWIPCPPNYSGPKTKPGSNCIEYVECSNGAPIGESVCSGENIFFLEETGQCEEKSIMDDWSCPPVPCQATNSPTTSPTVVTPSPITPTPKPTPKPFAISSYQDLRNYLTDREDMLKSTVFQSTRAYTFEDFITGLDVAALQLPVNKAFFSGEGIEGRLPKLSGLEYGLVNVALFLSNAMEMGIRIDSCDEWNTDYEQSPHEKYPLSNSCGQYGRSYEDEQCASNEPFHCSVDKTMSVTAVDSNTESNIPPFTCRARAFDGGREIFPGYFDSVDQVVIESAYANTLGRTDIAGCCYWGRGVMLTKGTCTLGKLDTYLGQGAAERGGIYVYPDINFCTNPEAICNHPRSNELRWVLGLLEWTDRVQSYVDSTSGFTYANQLKEFTNNGMQGTEFIESVNNIVMWNCHDALCADMWPISEETSQSLENRIENFRQIAFEILNLPHTYHPTISPTTSPPTLSPTFSQRPTFLTSKPTQKMKIVALPPSSANHWKSWVGVALSAQVVLIMALFI